MPNIIIKDADGNDVTYNNTDSVTFRNTAGGISNFVDDHGGALIGYKMTAVDVVNGVFTLPQGFTKANLGFGSRTIPLTNFSIINIHAVADSHYLKLEDFCTYAPQSSSALYFGGTTFNAQGTCASGGGLVTGTITTAKPENPSYAGKAYAGNLFSGKLYLYEKL